jgi:hypothetical protein
MAQSIFFRQLLEQGGGILNLVPTWVARPFNKPGKRLRLHPDDYYAMGMARGAITERWLSSVTRAESAGAGEHEGMSSVNADGDPAHKILFRDVVRELGADLIGGELMRRCGTWPMYSKFFDFNEPLFHHVHHCEAACARVGVLPKHEHYFFPKQYNNHPGTRPSTYFGFDPAVTREEVRARLADFSSRDTRILELSRGYQLQQGTGWFTPAGMLHAPGSLCTYEPQWNSDVVGVWENVVGSGEVFDRSCLNGYLPAGSEDDLDAILDTADWEINVLPNLRETFFRPPVPDCRGDGFVQDWICYGNDYVAAKELTVEPGASATVSDGAAYGCIVVQGRGEIGPLLCESPTLLRYGQLSADEFFVSQPASAAGVRIRNTSPVEPLVILKHFGPDCGMPLRKTQV